MSTDRLIIIQCYTRNHKLLMEIRWAMRLGPPIIHLSPKYDGWYYTTFQHQEQKYYA